MDITLESKKFTISYHGFSDGKMRRAYHCSTCKAFYAEGNYTIESSTLILGRHMRTFCCDDKELLTPYLFEDLGEVRDFLYHINMNIDGVRAILIKKNNLQPALYNPTLLAEYRKKHFN